MAIYTKLFQLLADFCRTIMGYRRHFAEFFFKKYLQKTTKNYCKQDRSVL